VGSARRSLETSLRELQTDYVDVLLLHEAKCADIETDGLRDFLAGAVREGKIRAFGVGTQFCHVREIAHGAPDFAAVVQFENSAAQQNIAKLSFADDRLVITHGAVKPLGDLQSSDKDEMQWEAFAERLRLGVASSPVMLAGLLLGFALWQNNGGVVLFSSLDPEHIAANAKTADELSRDDETWQAFGAAVQRVIEGAHATRPE
jgi:aryl-alcohol dehydrogenase-like predicted oxidoreductase